MPRKGQIWLKPGTNTGPKTGRRYGAVVSQLRAQFVGVPAFTPRLAVKVLAISNRDCMAGLLRSMARQGMVKVLSKGTPGRGGVEPLYTLGYSPRILQ